MCTLHPVCTGKSAESHLRKCGLQHVRLLIFNLCVFLDTLNDPNLVATVFAPTNEAFVKLEKSLGYTQEQLLNSAILKPTLQYHVVPKVAAQVMHIH